MKQTNKRQAMLYTLVMAAAAASGACSADFNGSEPESVDRAEQAVILTNRMSLNGVAPNALMPNGIDPNGSGNNGIDPNGAQLSGVALQDVKLNGISLQGTQLEGAELVAVRSDNGAVVRGEELVGATMTGVLTDGSTIALVIDAVDASSSDQAIVEYTVRTLAGSKSLCGETPDGEAITAVALTGRWDLSSGTEAGGDHIDDPSHFTFACNGAVLAKCVKLGYRPWETTDERDGSTCREVSQRPLHQACTRMMRADYCGDGTPHTQNGTPINLWDAFGIQQPELAAGTWKRDAEWSPEGAVCIKHTRYSDGTNDYIDAHCPERKTASFTCFGEESTFFTENGFDVDPEERSLLRNEFLHDYTKNH